MNFHKQKYQETLPPAILQQPSGLSAQPRDLPCGPGENEHKPQVRVRSICQGVSAHLDKALRFHSAGVKDRLHLGPQPLGLWLQPGCHLLTLFLFPLFLVSHEIAPRDFQTYRALGSRGVWRQADPSSKDLADKRYLSKVVHTELLLRTKVPYLIPT